MKVSTYHLRVTFRGGSDRRETYRFPVREEVRYRLLYAGNAPASGVGETLNISSGGILFTTEDRLPIGCLVEVAVSWPVQLDDACNLQFVAVGKVVRSEATIAAVRIDSYQFKTRGANRLAAGTAGQSGVLALDRLSD